MPESQLVTLLTNSGAGITALAVVFWLILKELPAQRKSREDSVVAFTSALEKITREFRDELHTERAQAATDREADRGVRHGLKDAVVAQSNSFNILTDYIKTLPCRGTTSHK
jgi:hypothetical protein